MNSSGKKISKYAYMFFLVVYCLSASDWELPSSSILRWVSMGIMAFFGMANTMGRSDQNANYGPYIYILVAYGIGVFCSDGNLNVGLQRSFAFFLLIYACYSYFQRGEVTSKEIIKYFKLFTVALIILMFALIVWYFQGNGGAFGEFYGIYGNKNYLVSISCTAVCATIYLLTVSKGFGRIIVSAALACSVFISLATGSRAGIICLACVFAMLPFIVIDASSFTRRLGIVVCLVVVFVVMYIIAINSDIPAIERLLSTDSGSETGFSRDVWQYGLEKFSQKPILGWGNSAAYYHTFILKDTSWGMHNSYLSILTDYGIVGSLLHLCFYISFLSRIIKRHKAISFTNDEKHFIKLLYVLCIMLMVNAIAETFLFAVGNISSVCYWINMVFIDLFLELKLKESNNESDLSKEKPKNLSYSKKF